MVWASRSALRVQEELMKQSDDLLEEAKKYEKDD